MKQLTPAIRQYKHNDGSDGFVIAYDKTETEKLVTELNAQIEFKTKEHQELAKAYNRYKKRPQK